MIRVHLAARLLAAPALALLLLAAPACSRTGMGDAVRKDVGDRMQTTQDPIAACYQTALQRNRKLRGRMVLSFTAEPNTGKFTGVQVTRDDLGDEPLRTCVVDKVSTLALKAPQKSAVSVTYPLDFAPIK